MRKAHCESNRAMSSSQAQPTGPMGARNIIPAASLGTVAHFDITPLFPDEDYRFHIRFDRRDVGAFFQPTSDYSTLIAERRHWLTSAPKTYTDLQPEGIPLLEETIAMAHRLGTVPKHFSVEANVNETARDQCLALGTVWEPDFLRLKLDPNGELRLTGGWVCFPSSWSLTARVGKTVGFIHEAVPGLNPSLKNRIDHFLKKLRPGIS